MRLKLWWKMRIKPPNGIISI
ncbi:hypothetical protein RDI58_014723 [Solanum bulbocastanum]|uniref:Uncharacterized protein n=1 Tax=Solanum bulbocastanum TaxID=147425 RepID=A0AAN8TCW3_SOLBU